MLNIITAFHVEAQPLIEYFQLKKLVEHNVFETYRNDEQSISLTISGLGKLNASAAVIYSASLKPISKNDCWINIGIAGHPSIEIGTAILANKVIDESSHQNWYPQIVFDTDIIKAPLTTVDEPTANYPSGSAVDMEASGFLSSASRISTTELIHCLKIISDNKSCSFKSLNKQKIKAMIQDNIHCVTDILSKLENLTTDAQDSKIIMDIYQALIDPIHFTHSEKNKLKKILHKWNALMPDAMPDLNYCIGLKNANKILNYLSENLNKHPVSFQ